MTSIWKFHADRLRKAAAEYVEAVHAYLAETGDVSDALTKMESAERAVEVALTICDAQDATDKVFHGSR